MMTSFFERLEPKPADPIFGLNAEFQADPRKDKNAKPIDKITWTDFRKLVGDEWIPGMNAPFDPVASKHFG